MNIEQLRKVQETAKKLRQHSIVDSTNEALEEVKKQLDIGGAEVPAITISKIDQRSSTTIIKSTGGQMDEEKLKEVNEKISRHAELIDKQAKLIYQLQEKINEIIREIHKMQTTMPTQNPKERQRVLETEEKKEHPRSGGYKPEDVAIEKMFYSGSK